MELEVDCVAEADRKTTWARVLLAVLDAGVLVSLLLMCVAWFYDPLRIEQGPFRLSVSWGIKPVLVPILVLTARAVWSRRRGLHGVLDRPVVRKLGLALLLPFACLAALEWLAGRMGVQPDPRTDVPIVITGEELSDTRIEDGRITRCPELLFAFVPGTDWNGFPVNEHGFRTRPFSAKKPDGTVRVVALGDSCTAQGEPPYSDRLHARLQDARPTEHEWEAFNMGVFGYSVLQGHRQFLKYGRQYDPDVVTIYFGWNGHWLNQRPDHLRMAVRVNPAAASVLKAIRSKRLYAGLQRVLKRGTRDSRGTDGKTVRVPEPVYERTLAALIRDVRAAGVIPLVLTAPRRSLTNTLVKSGHARSVAEAEALHDRYVELTRKVARASGAELLDLAAMFAGPEHDDCFSRDGIHFTDKGLDCIAATLHAKLGELVGEGHFAQR